MDELQQKLYQLITEACSHPVGSRERQKYLTQIIRFLDARLWYENIPYYEDALQQTWIYFCQNICEGKTGQPYDPDRASVVTWLNAYLKRRLQDFSIASQKEQARTSSNYIEIDKDNKSIDIVENIEAKPDLPSLLEEVKKWVETDPQKILRRIHLQNRPEINCQILILKRLPPPTAWKTLAQEFDVSSGTLSSFYQRQCLPQLREFGKSEGYL
jgi:hypothetical protein